MLKKQSQQKSLIYSFLPPVFLVMDRPNPEETVTSSFGRFIQRVQPSHLSPVVLQRSKRMVLDSIGVGLLGSTTEVFELALQHCQVMAQNSNMLTIN